MKIANFRPLGPHFLQKARLFSPKKKTVRWVLRVLYTVHESFKPSGPSYTCPGRVAILVRSNDRAIYLDYEVFLFFRAPVACIPPQPTAAEISAFFRCPSISAYVFCTCIIHGASGNFRGVRRGTELICLRFHQMPRPGRISPKKQSLTLPKF